jgi:hypothetical protein
MRCVAAGALLSSLLVSGCAITSDLIYLATGPGNSPTLRGTALPIGPGESSREVKLDREHGLVCSFKDSPQVRGSSIEMETVFPNGIAPMMWIATGLEGILGIGQIGCVGPYSLQKICYRRLLPDATG